MTTSAGGNLFSVTFKYPKTQQHPGLIPPLEWLDVVGQVAMAGMYSRLLSPPGYCPITLLWVILVSVRTE